MQITITIFRTIPELVPRDEQARHRGGGGALYLPPLANSREDATTEQAHAVHRLPDLRTLCRLLDLSLTAECADHDHGPPIQRDGEYNTTR